MASQLTLLERFGNKAKSILSEIGGEKVDPSFQEEALWIANNVLTGCDSLVFNLIDRILAGLKNEPVPTKMISSAVKKAFISVKVSFLFLAPEFLSANLFCNFNRLCSIRFCPLLPTPYLLLPTPKSAESPLPPWPETPNTSVFPFSFFLFLFSSPPAWSHPFLSLNTRIDILENTAKVNLPNPDMRSLLEFNSASVREILDKLLTFIENPTILPDSGSSFQSNQGLVLQRKGSCTQKQSILISSDLLQDTQVQLKARKTGWTK